MTPPAPTRGARAGQRVQRPVQQPDPAAQAEGKVELTAIYDVEPSRRAAAPGPQCDTIVDARGADRQRRRRRRAGADEHERARTAGAARDAGKHVLVEKPMATSIAEADSWSATPPYDGLLVCAPHVVLSPDVPRASRCVHARRDRPSGAGPCPLRVGRAVVGRLVLQARRRCPVRPRRLQPHDACAVSSGRCGG